MRPFQSDWSADTDDGKNPDLTEFENPENMIPTFVVNPDNYQSPPILVCKIVIVYSKN